MDITGSGLRIGVQGETGTSHQFHATLGEMLDADLGPTQIAQDADFLACGFADSTHAGNAGAVIIGVAVGKIEPDHIHAGSDQGLQYAGCIRGRAEGGEDLGFSCLGHGKSDAGYGRRSVVLKKVHCGRRLHPRRPRPGNGSRRRS